MLTVIDIINCVLYVAIIFFYSFLVFFLISSVANIELYELLMSNLTHKLFLLLVFQSGTRVKNVYASLANGTLVVFTPASVSTARRPSHNDVTLETKEDDEQLTRERDKWSSVQVCGTSFIVKGPINQIAGYKNFALTIPSLSIEVSNHDLFKSKKKKLF